MITNIKVKNFKSIYEEINLDFTKSQINYHDHYVLSNNIVNPVILYGDNASGKSCFLEAFNTINKLMNADINNNFNLVYFDYNRYLGKHKENISIELTMVIDKHVCVYQVVGIDFDEILIEKLFIDGEEVLQVSEEVYKYSKLREAANKNIDKMIVKVYNFLGSINFMTLHGSISSNQNKSLIDFIINNELRINQILSLLNDMKYYYHFIIERRNDGTRELNYREYEGNDYNAYFKKQEMPVMSYETHMSNGMKKLFYLLGFLIELPKGSVVVIDEIENMIHPTTLIKLIEIFNTLFNIQLIVSTHNTALMKHLRPDQIYLVYMQEHNSYIKRLNTFYPKLREIHNIEKLFYNNVIRDKLIESIEKSGVINEKVDRRK